jgi:hypothetical protein
VGSPIADKLTQEENFRKQFLDTAKFLAEMQPKDYIRQGPLGDDLNFSDAGSIFERIVNLGKQLLTMNYEMLPQAAIQALNQKLSPIKTKLIEIEAFRATQGEVVRNQLCDQIYDAYNSFVHTCAGTIGFVARSNEEIQELKSEAQNTVFELKTETQNALKEISTAKKEAKESVDAVKRSAAELGLTAHSVHFVEQAKADGDEAAKWLRWTLITSIAVVGFGFLLATNLLWPISDSAGASEIVRHMLPKLVLLSIGGFGIGFCAKTYSAFKHMQAVNLHRKNALATFQAFAKAAQNEQVQDAILLQASQSIFGPRPTGFLKNEMDGNETKSVFEVIGSAAAKSLPTGKG